MADLKDLYPPAKDIFICPICFREYKSSDIQNERLTRGDIWPKYIREKSRSSKQQIVLLCKDCNSVAGERGDAQMNLMEQIKDTEEKNMIYGRRRVILKKENDEPITINANVTIDNDTKTMTISGRLDKNLNWVGNSPKMQERFERLIGNKEPININIDSVPAKSVTPNPEQAPVGWITSAYLFAFYTFGYRYILHSNLEPVRKYIISSFDKANVHSLDAKKDEAFELREYEEKYFHDPEMNLIVPIDNRNYVYLEINFLRYQIKLPFQFAPSILESMIYSNMPDINKKLSALEKSGDHIYFKIVHSKADCAECILDYLLGKPIPKQI